MSVSHRTLPLYFLFILGGRITGRCHDLTYRCAPPLPNNEIYKRARCHSGRFLPPSMRFHLGQLYGFAKPTGPHQRKILRGNVYPLLFCILLFLTNPRRLSRGGNDERVYRLLEQIRDCNATLSKRDPLIHRSPSSSTSSATDWYSATNKQERLISDKSLVYLRKKS